MVAASFGPPKPKSATHLIGRYYADKQRILCDCGWEDDENLFRAHRKSSGAIKVGTHR